MKHWLALCFLLTACHSKPATQQPANAKGTLSGSVHLVGPACETPGPGCDGPAAAYEVVVYQADGTTVATKAMTKDDGTFSADLPPGKYIILTPSGVTELAKTEVEVTKDALAKIELTVDHGARANEPPQELPTDN